MAKVNLNVQGAFIGDKPKVNLNVDGAFSGDLSQKKNPIQNDISTVLSGKTSSTDGKSELPNSNSAWYDWNNIKKAGTNLIDFGKGLGQEIPSETTRMVGDLISSFGLAVDLGGRYSSAGINYLMGDKKQAQKDIDSDPTFLGKYLVDAGNYLSESADQTKDDTLKNWGVSEKNRSPQRTFYDAFSDGDLGDGSAMLFRDVLATVPQVAAAVLSGGGSLEAQALRKSGGLLKQTALSEMGAIASTELPAILSTGLKSQTGAQFKFGLGLGTSSSLAEEYKKDNHVTATDFLESIARGVVEGASESLFDTDILAAKKLASKFVNVSDNPAIKGIMASIVGEGEDAAKDKIVRTTTDILGKAFAGGRNEGFEEVASSFGNMLIDATKQGGFTMESLDKFKRDAIESFIVGSLSGGVISGGAARLSRVKLTDIQQKTIDRYNEVINDDTVSDEAKGIAKERIKDILDFNASLSKDNYALIAALPKEKRAEALGYLSSINKLEEDIKNTKDSEGGAFHEELGKDIKSYEDKVNNLIDEEYKSQREARKKVTMSQSDIDTEDIISFFQSTEKQGFSIEDMDSALNDIRTKVNNKEEIDQKDIGTANDMLYEIIDNIEKSELTTEQKKIASDPFFNQIKQLESYDKTIKTTEVTTPIQEVTTTTRETGRRERPKTTVLTDRFNLEPIEVTDSEGNKSNFVAKVNEDGSISLVPKVKFSRTATEQKRKGIELDYNFLEFQESIKDENDRVIGARLLDKKTGNTIEISNPELAIDLATKAKQDALGNVSEGIMSQEKTVTPVGQLTSIVKEFVNKRATKVAPQATAEIAEEQAPALITEVPTSPVGLPSRRAYVVEDDVETKKGNKILNKISPEIKKRIANYVKSLKATIPNSTVVLYDNKADMIEGLVNQGYSRQEATKAVNESDGLYAGSSNTIHIDVMRMDKTTLPHEIFHPLVARLAKENPTEFIALRKRISKVLSESQLKELDAFAAQYSDKGKAVEAEEFLSQLGGLVTANKAKMERGTLMKLALAVKEFLKKIAAKTNSKVLNNFADSIFTEQTKTDDLIKFFEGFGRSLRQGEVINTSSIPSLSNKELISSRDVLRQKKSYPDAFEESRNEYLDKFKNTPKEVSRYLRKVLFERNINVKKAFEDAELEFSLYTMYNKAGASMFGNLKFTEKFNEIYRDLNTEDIKLLDNFILLRRTVAIDTNFDNREESRPEHPDHKNIDGVKTATNKESALSTLEDYKDLLGDELYNKIYNLSDKYFKAFSDILKYKYENGLVNKETYELYKDYNYSPRKFLQFMFGTSISEESKLTTNNFYQRGLALSKDELSKIQSGSTKGLFVDSAKLLHAAMIATEVRVASNLALKTLYNEAIPANLDFVKEVEYEKYQDGTIKINPDGSLKYVKTADEGFRIVTFKEDGIVKAFQLKEDLAKEYFDEELFDKNSKAYKFAQIASGSNILRNMATGMNLAFFVTNIPVDALSQVQFSSIHDGASVGAPGQFASAIAGTLIKSGQLLPLEFGFKNKALEDLIYEYGKAGGLMMTLTEEYSSKAKFLGNIPKYLGSFGNASEMGSKLNAYEKVRNSEIKKYKEQNGKEPVREDLAKIQTKAAYIARAAMDYHRGGLLTKWIDGFIPYLNVLSQATKITADYIVKNPKDFTDKITQMGIFVIGLTIYNLMVAGGDYDNDDNEQDLLTKIVIFSPFKDADGKRGKLEIGTPDMVKKFLNIFQSIGEGIYYQAILGEKQKTDEWKIAKRAQYLSSFDLKLPSNIPPALKAMVEYKYNLDLWRNKDITKQLGDVLPQDEGRYNPSVASFYKIIGSSTGMSPIRLQKASENFITQSNPLVGIGYSLMDKMVNNYANLPESQRSKYDKGNISDIPLAAFDKIAGRLYSKTDPTVTYTKGKDIIDRINQTAGSKKQEAKAEMKLLVEKKASIAELNAFLIKQDPIYRKAAVEYRDMLQKKAKLNYPDFQEKYYDIMLGQNAEAKAQIVYTYFPYILNKGNEKLVQDLNELNLVGKDTKVYLNRYVSEKGIKE